MKLLGFVIIRPGPRVREVIEAVQHGSPCGECGCWRCPECHWMILDWRDHHVGCTRRQRAVQ